ncbi:MAG: hypothetical protein RL264_419 [Bacteroidota bacterium]|jgi:lycopene cyclase domain-containing protein
MSLYLAVVLAAFAGPLALSFDRKVHFYTHWKTVFIAISIVATGFIIWDEWFTQLKVWGFTPRYLLGIYLGHLPLEEILFFFIVPYNCVFIHEVQKAYFKKIPIAENGKLFGFGFALISMLVAFFFFGRFYTTGAGFVAVILIALVLVTKQTWFGRFWLTYLIAVIPFLIVNGILTGMFTEKPIVWYNSEHIIGWRIVTIPVEDLIYNFDMLLPIIWIHESLKRN